MNLRNSMNTQNETRKAKTSNFELLIKLQILIYAHCGATIQLNCICNACDQTYVPLTQSVERLEAHKHSVNLSFQLTDPDT
jgi:hypothetical protein